MAFFLHRPLGVFHGKVLSFKSGSKEAEVINQRIQEHKKERTIDLSFILTADGSLRHLKDACRTVIKGQSDALIAVKTTRSNTRASIGIPLARLSDSF